MLQQKKTKELEIAKIQATQKASQDLQAIKDSLSALRTQDKVYKMWLRCLITLNDSAG